MKINTWLLLSYFVVMVLPLLSLYLLFASVTSYQSGQKVEEYYEAYADIQEMIAVLDDPEWYRANSDIDKLKELTQDDVAIQLYNSEGLKLYHSIPDLNMKTVLNKEQLYQNLYEVQEGLRAYTYREPVFDDGALVGFFDIEIARGALIDTIIKRGWIVIGLFLASFFLVYVAVAYFVHKRVTNRLYGLKEEITAFARGKIQSETPIKKDEIGELKSHFYQMRNQVISAQEATKREQEEKEFIVASISHDLKTPLTSIKAYTESLQTQKTLSKHDEAAYQRIIIEKTDYIKEMLNDLTTYSILQSGDYNMEVVTVDGEEFFDMLVSDYDALGDQHDINLKVYSNTSGLYDVNPQQLIRVVDNLIGNAMKYTPRHGRVWLVAIDNNTMPSDWLFDYVRSQYVFEFDRNAYLIVQNEGIGIKETAMSQLFQPLYQVDQARSKKDGQQGTGLGLSITKQIIERHGGSVTAISEEGHGACFICQIPKRGEVS